MKSILQKLLHDDPVVVTGLGVISAGGVSTTEFWRNVSAGIVSAEWRDFEFAGQTLRRAVCAAPSFGPQVAHFPRIGKMHRAIQMALAACRQAWAEAGLDRGDIALERIGVAIGTARGPMESPPRAAGAMNPPRVLPSFSANSTIASLSGATSQFLALRGPSVTISATCTSAAAAIAFGAEQILLGLADVMLVGGADAVLNPLIVAQLDAAGILGHHVNPQTTCRPFDKSRNGICLGEGAGILILESARAAQRRGARPLARLAGWATGVETAGRAGVGQGGEMLAHLMNRALHVADLSPAAIDYLNAHGTGTVMNDAAEAAGIRKVFSGQAAPPPCSSTKPVTGHCLGATPALEALVCLQALQHQTIPPTANCREQDPACAIDVTPLHARPASLKTVMSTSLGFWGNHAALIFSADT